MPGFDGTGPMGAGPGTGWGLGPCGAGMAWRRGFGRGLGYGRGLGWRRLWGYYPTPTYTQKDEKEILKADAADLEEELKAIKARLAELEGEK